MGGEHTALLQIGGCLPMEVGMASRRRHVAQRSNCDGTGVDRTRQHTLTVGSCAIFVPDRSLNASLPCCLKYLYRLCPRWALLALARRVP